MLNNFGKIKQYLEAIVKEKKEKSDDWNVYDASGGNFDDAYSIGLEDGEQELAVNILKMLSE